MPSVIMSRIGADSVDKVFFGTQRKEPNTR
jgi:hypothetical protein